MTDYIDALHSQRDDLLREIAEYRAREIVWVRLLEAAKEIIFDNDKLNSAIAATEEALKSEGTSNARL